MMFPKTYGEVMRPLDVNQLPMPLLLQYQCIPRVKEWVHIADRVRRAEKVSSWTQWSAGESAANEVDDYRLFSRLRGYNEAEIEEFERFIALCDHLGEDFCFSAEIAMNQIVRTPEYHAVEGILYDLSQVASTGRDTTSNMGLAAQDL